MSYEQFLRAKVPGVASIGFEIDPSAINPRLKPHQRAIVRWMVAGGRRACFAAFVANTWGHPITVGEIGRAHV